MFNSLRNSSEAEKLVKQGQKANRKIKIYRRTYTFLKFSKCVCHKEEKKRKKIKKRRKRHAHSLLRKMSVCICKRNITIQDVK